jgi:riboflavin synthase
VFTGLVADLGEVTGVDATDAGARLTVHTGLARELAPGDSVAVNGTCLTATAVHDGAFTAEAMNQTLRMTSLGALAPGARVNLELALRAGDRLGGHMMQGHVDGTGRVSAVEPDGFARRVTIAPADPGLLRYVVPKGSIAVDGVSLTVSAVDERSFSVSLIPETLERTNLGVAGVGTPVNLEVDVLAKYVEKLVVR